MDSLIPKYRELAKTADGNFQGLSILQHQKSIGALIKATGSQTLLDFGCGRGDAYRSPHKIHHTWGLSRKDCKLYDPAFHTNNTLPGGRYDIVVCSDVVEHLLEEEVDEFVARLFGYAKRAVWASFCSRPAKKFFPGTDMNLHTCVKPAQWWHDTFAEHAPQGVVWELVETP